MVLFLSIVLLPLQIKAIEYGGIGGKPANPDPNNDRTKSVFIFNLEPGQEKDDSLLVVNNTAVAKTLMIYSTDSQKSTDGSFACEQYSDTKEGVGSWIYLEQEEITLEPATNTTLDFKIMAPENVSVGEENGCIMIQEKKVAANGDASGVSLSFRTGIRVVVTIPGQQERKLNLDSFELVEAKEKLVPKISVSNIGNVSVDANLTIQINGLFNIPLQTIQNTYPILRNDISTYTYEIEKPFWGGVIYSTATADYDNSQDASVGVDPIDNPNVFIQSELKTLFVMPQPVALATEVAALIILIAVITLIIKRNLRQKKLKKSWNVNYFVKDGEDIESIAKSQKLNWKDIAKYNNLSAPYTLKTGQKIVLPAKSK